MNSQSATLFQVDSYLNKINISRELELILVATLFVSSLLLRVLFIGLTEFKSDEAYWCWSAWEWLNGGDLPLRGQSTSVPNTYLGPLTTYLTALAFLIFNPNPEFAIFMVAWMNSLAVIVVYLTGRDMFDYRAELIAALLMSFSPWAIIYSRKIWPQSYLPFTSSIIIFLFYRAIKSRKPIYFLIGGFTLGTSLQFHPTAFLIVPVILILLLINRSQIYSILIVVLGVIAGCFPMLVFDFLNNWVNIKSYIWIFLNPKRTRPRHMSRFTHSYLVLRFFLDITGGTGIESFYGRFYPSSLMFLEVFSIEMILIVVYIFWIFITGFKILRRKKLLIGGQSPHFLLILWLIIPLMIHFISSELIYPHYFVIFYPANFLAIASFINHFLQNMLKISLKIKNHSLKIPVLGVLTAFIILFHLITISTFLYTVNNTGGIGAFGSTLENKKAAVNWVISDEDFYDYRVVVQADYYHTDYYTYQYLFKIHGKEMSEGKPIHYYYILELESSTREYAILDEYMGAKVDDYQTFGSIIIIKTRP